jgi:hypothetical protein
MYATSNYDFRELADLTGLPRYGKKKGDYQCPLCGGKIWSSSRGAWGTTCSHDTKEGKWEIKKELLKRAGLWVEHKSDRPKEYQQDYTAPSQYLTEELKEELAASAIPEGPWQSLNFSSIKGAGYIAYFLGWRGYRGPDGWISTMGNGQREQNQFKPSTPIEFLNKDKALLSLAFLTTGKFYLPSESSKYLTSKAGYGALIPKVPGDGANKFWKEIDKLRITEGAKKVVSSMTNTGVPTVGICGVSMWHAKGSKELLPELAKLVKDREVEIAFDSDFARKGAVWRQIVDMARAIEKAKGRPVIRVWDESYGKGIDDVIVAGHDFEAVSEVLTVKEFRLKYPNPDEYFYEPSPEEFLEYQQHLEFLEFIDEQNWKRKKEIEAQNRVIWLEKKRELAHKKWQRSLEFSPDWTQTKGKYCDPGVFSPQISPFIALKAHQGAGKTGALEAVLRWHIGEGRTVAVIGSRNSCLVQTARRLGIQHLIVDGDGNSLVALEYRGWAHCINSILRWKDAEKLPEVLVLDEISSLLPHTFLGSTCRDRRVEILDFLGEILKQVEYCYLLDAGLKDWEVKVIEALSGKSFYQIEKESPKDLVPYKIYNYVGTDSESNPGAFDIGKFTPSDKFKPNDSTLWRKQFLIEVEKHPVAGFLDSIKEIKRLIVFGFGEDNLDFHTALSNGILRVDSETRNYPEVHQFLADPVRFLIKYKIKVLLCSPSVESGVSIAFDREELERLGLALDESLDYFGAMFIYNCHINNEPIWQMMGRIRDRNCPRHLFVKEFAPTTTHEENSEFEKQWIEAINTSINEFISRQNAINEFTLAPNILEAFGDITSKAQQLIEANLSGDMVLYHQISRQILNQHRYEKQNLRATLIERFLAEGAIIKEVVGPRDFKPDTKAANKAIALHRATELFNAEVDDEMTVAKAESLYQEYLATPEERLGAERFLFTNKLLPGIESEDFWSVKFLAEFKHEHPEIYGQIYHRLYTENPELFEELEALGALAKVELQQLTLTTDINQTLPFTQTLKKVGLLELSNKEKIHKDDIEAVAKKANNKNYTRYLGKKGKLEPTQWINKPLKKIGKRITKLIAKGKECLDYCVEDLLAKYDWFENVKTLVLRKYQARLEKARQRIENMAEFINNKAAKKVNSPNNNCQSQTEHDLDLGRAQGDEPTINTPARPTSEPCTAKDTEPKTASGLFSPPKAKSNPRNKIVKFVSREDLRPDELEDLEKAEREMDDNFYDDNEIPDYQIDALADAAANDAEYLEWQRQLDPDL